MGIELSRRGLLIARTAVFRVDSVWKSGFRRFMRCRNIALELLKRNWVVFFVGEDFPEDCTQFRYGFSGLNFINFVSEADSMKDTKKFIQLLTSGIFRSSPVIIIDSARFRREDYAVLQLFANSYPIAVIDDLAQFDTPAQVVINPNPGFSPDPYQRQKIPEVLCGAEYCLISSEITRYKNREYNCQGPVVIDYGSSFAQIAAACRAVADVSEQKIMVISDDSELNEKLHSYCTEQKIAQKTVSSKKRAEILAGASLVITRNGSQLWDIYCLGVPNICILWGADDNSTFELFKHQASGLILDLFSNLNSGLKSETIETGIKELVKMSGDPAQTREKFDSGFRTAEIIDKFKTSVVIEADKDIDLAVLRKAVMRLSSGCQFAADMVQNQKRLIDGAGVERIVDVLENLQWRSAPLFNADYWRAYEDW